MELRQLEHFVAVAEEESFTRAARRLGYVQSALSVSVQALERELAVRLLDRTTHRVSLTGAGATLLPAARATLAGAHALRDEAAALNGVVRGTLRIGIMQGFSAVNVPAALGRFHREHPLVEITVEPSVGGAGALQARVAAGELDVAFVAVGEVPAGLHARALASEPLLLTYGRGFTPPLTGGSHRSVPLERLRDESFVEFPPGWAVRREIDRGFRALGIERRVAIEVADVGTHLSLVREGLGVALLPQSLVGRHSVAVDTVRTNPSLRWRLAVLTRADPAADREQGGGELSPAALAFLELLEGVEPR